MYKQIWAQNASLWSSSGFLRSCWSCWYLDSPLWFIILWLMRCLDFIFTAESEPDWGCYAAAFFSSPSSLSVSRFLWLQDHSAILMLPQRSQSTAALSLSPFISSISQ